MQCCLDKSGWTDTMGTTGEKMHIKKPLDRYTMDDMMDGDDMMDTIRERRNMKQSLLDRYATDDIMDTIRDRCISSRILTGILWIT